MCAKQKKLNDLSRAKKIKIKNNCILKTIVNNEVFIASEEDLIIYSKYEQSDINSLFSHVNLLNKLIYLCCSKL